METFEDRLNQILFQSPSGVRILSYDVLYEEIEVYSFNPRKGCEFHFTACNQKSLRSWRFNPRKGCEFHSQLQKAVNRHEVSIPARGVNFISQPAIKKALGLDVSIPARGVNFIVVKNKGFRRVVRFQSPQGVWISFIIYVTLGSANYVSIPARGVNFINKHTSNN